MTPRPLLLVVAAATAPIFWLGQVLLSYLVTAQGCYPGDAPRPAAALPALQMTIWTFDALALAAALAGGAISLWAWRGMRGAPQEAIATRANGRDRFLVLWGLCANLGFFLAIVFNAIATVTVTPCAS